MSLGYRSIFDVPGRRDDVIPVALAQLHAWLRHKRLDPSAAALGRRTSVADGVELTVQELEGGDRSRSLRARLVETRAMGTWTTTLTVHVPGDAEREPWVWLDVDAPDGQPWTARPKLAELLLTVFEGREGTATLGSAPQVVAKQDVPALVETILDPDRRRLLFVAGSDAQMPIRRWVGLLERLLRETVGLAGAYVLDATATDELRRLLGARYSVAPGTVRTYSPRVDLESDVDSVRHRILSTERIVRGDAQAIARTLGARSRETVIELPLPRAVVRVDRSLERNLDALMLAPRAVQSSVIERDVATVAPPAPSSPDVEAVSADIVTATAASPSVSAPTRTDAALHDALAAATAEILGDGEPTLKSLVELADLARIGKAGAERRDELAHRLEELRTQLAFAEDERDELRRQLDDEQLDHAETLQERASADALVLHLRKIVMESDSQVDVWTPPDAEAAPSTFDELLEMAAGLEHVDCSRLDHAVARELDDHDQLGSWARKTWEILQTLSDECQQQGRGWPVPALVIDRVQGSEQPVAIARDGQRCAAPARVRESHLGLRCRGDTGDVPARQ